VKARRPKQRGKEYKKERGARWGKLQKKNPRRSLGLRGVAAVGERERQGPEIQRGKGGFLGGDKLGIGRKLRGKRWGGEGGNERKGACGGENPWKGQAR